MKFDANYIFQYASLVAILIYAIDKHTAGVYKQQE